MVFQDLNGQEVSVPMEPADPYRHLPGKDRALMGMVEKLGYSMADAASILQIPVQAAHRRYWFLRTKVRPPTTLREKLLSRSPTLLARDLCALELVEVLDYSIGKAANVLGMNKGHLCRRIALARAAITEAGDPRSDAT